MNVRSMLPIACLLTVGCWGRNIDYEGGGPVDTSGPETVSCGEEPEEVTGWRIEGVTLDLETGLAPAMTAGLCATAIDPSPVLAGGDPVDLAVGQVCDDGVFKIFNLGDAPAVGMFVVIDDCPPGFSGDTADESDDEQANTVLRSANGMKSDDIVGLGAGDVYYMNSTDGDADTSYLSRTYQVTIEAELVEYEGSLDDSGFLGGRILDSSLNPVEGATIDCGNCGLLTASYQDDDASDGLFLTGTTANAATLTSGSGRYFLPGAGVSTYTIDDGGTHTWDATLLGSLPGYAVFSNFTATN
jgi:hypothetical protein